MSFNLKICQDKQCLYLHVLPRWEFTGGFSITCALHAKGFIGVIPQEVNMQNNSIGENVISMPIEAVKYSSKSFTPPSDCPYKLEHVMGWKK